MICQAPKELQTNLNIECLLHITVLEFNSKANFPKYVSNFFLCLWEDNLFA